MTATTLTIVGNLTGDPELKYTPAGAALCRFTVASTPRVFDKGTNAYADGDPLFLTCTAWRDLAEHIADSLAKGSRVIVTGRLKLSRWETKEGEKRSTFSLDVDEIGPSLRFAIATVTKATRSHGGPAAADDPWATASRSRPASSGADNLDEFAEDEPAF